MATPARPAHESYMREALFLARQPKTLPYPNPWVGCVVVNRGKVVGRGSHRGPGFPHAETEALEQAGPRARGASLYVTLEPCCHQGRTPPCTEAILEYGIRKVFYAIRDNNPLVNGGGVRLLRRHGLVVKGGLCSQEASALNEVYLKYRVTGLPFVTVKVAASLDGKIATRTGESKWITDPTARRRSRGLRAENQAALVGIGTVLADNPHLGPRGTGQPEPWRIVLDSRLRTPPESQVIRSGRCIVACAAEASPKQKAELEGHGARVWSFRGRKVPLEPLLTRLAAEGILSVLVEGGSEVLGGFFDGGFVDRVYWFVSPMIIGSAESPSAVAGKGAARLADAWHLRLPKIERVGESWLLRGNASPWALDSA